MNLFADLKRFVFKQPEGIRQCYSVSSLIDLDDDESDRDGIASFNENLSIRIPDGIVEGSEKATLHAYGRYRV